MGTRYRGWLIRATDKAYYVCNQPKENEGYCVWLPRSILPYVKKCAPNQFGQQIEFECEAWAVKTKGLDAFDEV